MAEMGHEDQFRPSSLNGGCLSGEATFAEMTTRSADSGHCICAAKSAAHDPLPYFRQQLPQLPEVPIAEADAVWRGFPDVIN
jgi:hypothetical protein